jgi:AmmeMemoRadiSam system protein A
MLESHHHALLLDTAREAILHDLRPEAPRSEPDATPGGVLGETGASFVTLTTAGALRGCCGSVERHQPLLHDVWHNARRAAFADPRFPVLSDRDVPDSALEIAVLGPLRELPVESEQELLERLRPGIDGLLMSLGLRRATFLPKVWEQLPEPERFMAHLKHKLGVSTEFWSAQLTFQRYQTTSFGGALSVEDPAMSTRERRA